MPTKRVPPLTNPPSEKVVAVADKSNKIKSINDSDSNGRGKGVSKGGRERVSPVEALVKCLMCGRVQKLVFRHGKAPEWHRCIWCRELYPVDGYKVIAYGLDLPQPLAPHEVDARQREIDKETYNPHQ